ncbi:MAG TPA: Ppx/GppA phosphatase family protein [Thermoplasmata archaeon]|nr:Ppx/GppA phosphatase family protein [Thermoplasmata archaeon]
MQRASVVAAVRNGTPATPARSLLGVIDVGSNTARLVVFQSSSAGAVRAIDERKEVPRLGEGTAADGSLSSEAIKRGVTALRRFAKVLESLGVERALAVATSAVREAPNAAAFLDQVERATGIEIRTITGTEEARYAYLGVASAWELANDLVCDLGGGSLQIVEVRKGALRNSVSLPLGALRLSQRYLENDPPKSREVDELRESARETIGGALEAFGGSGYRAFCVGGTVRALARAAINMRDYPIVRVHGYELRDHDIDALFELLSDMPAAKRRAISGIGSDRVDVIVAGVVVFQELLRASKARSLTVSGTGIREGVALEALGTELPAPADELARRSVIAASESLGFSFAHGDTIANVAAALFDELAPRLEWGPSERRALVVAAWMHDSGIAVDLWRHERHSAYLVRNFPIWGLDQREVVLASMATYLHGGDPAPSTWRKLYLALLSGHDLEIARGLGAVLQAAEALHAGAPKFNLAGGGKALSVEFGDAAAAGLSPKALDKARKPLEREFQLEVRTRDS